jgi:hypothetical protein
LNTRTALLSATLGALAVTASASATTLKLDLDVTRDPDNAVLLGQQPDGTVTYGMNRALFFSQTFRAAVTGDDGAPVTGCLDGASQIELVDNTGVVRYASACASAASGMFEFLPSGAQRIDRPTVLVARLTAPATSTNPTARVLSPAVSNPVVMNVRPRLVDESPGTARASRFPIKVRVEVPAPRPGKGKIVLQRKAGAKWISVASRKLDAAGRFKQTVSLIARKTTFRLLFVPTPGNGWIQTGGTITLTRI